MTDLCGRCLVNLNARVSVAAHLRDGGVIPAPAPQSPRRLAAWVREQLAAGATMLHINGQPDAFVPVATWHGDPVCEAHLVERRQAELLPSKTWGPGGF